VSNFLRFGLFILLIATAAFVIDVLSPATPTPNADLTAKLLVAIFSILILLSYRDLRPETIRYRWTVQGILKTRGPRALLVWLRVLLA
jgi:hypothetical protein